MHTPSHVKNGQPDWKQWWSDRTDAGSRPESNIAKEVRERLFLLDGGESLLDFGCGAADLLIHYAPHYARVVGADASESMLAQANLKVQERQYEHVRLLHADERSVWSAIDEPFDRITSTQVIQHLDPEQVHHFISQAAEYLNPGGQIALFDIIDPRFLTLHQLGLLSSDRRLSQIARSIGNRSLEVIFAKIRNRPSNWYGYTYSQGTIERMAREFGMDVDFARSMYYEYRYHALLSKKACTSRDDMREECSE